MKILLLADEESAHLWDYYRPEYLKDIDLIISCGDLKAEYLRFLVTMGHAPLLYVHGNHDTNYRDDVPEGCECIEDRIVNVGGVRIMGLGGSISYNGGEHQYTEQQMERRIRRMKRQLKKQGGVDVVVTHAPPRGCGDQPDLVHRGFEAFLPLLDQYQPGYLLHGHIHRNYGSNLIRECRHGETRIINGTGYYVLDIPSASENGK